MKVSRTWAMPNSETFSIKPIKELLEPQVRNGVWVDPFVRNSCFKDLMTMTNDLNPEFEADYNIDAIDFLKRLASDSVDGVLFDPPYSPRQISECYQNVGRTVSSKDTQSSFWGDLKKEIGRILKVGGTAISFGWNSGGIGKSNGFEMQEILMVAHGGWHNDTIVTVEKKIEEGDK